MREATEREKWFNDRIGKRVYRNLTSCGCLTCQRVYKEGLIIADETHASYLYDIEGIFTAEGSPTGFFDTVEERDKFEKELA